MKLSHIMAGGLLALSGMTCVWANDSTGVIASGGVQYLKNKQISMHSEDLLISKHKIRVQYQFKNLSDQDITETVLFPLPKVINHEDMPMPDQNELQQSFKIWANGKSIKPTINVRAFMFDVKNGERIFPENYDASIDTTELFYACGVTEQELLNSWKINVSEIEHTESIQQKLLNCNNKKLQALLVEGDKEHGIDWQTQIIYSWQQRFPAKSTTQIKHEYQPMLGGGVSTNKEGLAYYCADHKSLQRAEQYQTKNTGHIPYQALSYILTTGANWATPIQDFKLTIQRDKDELVSLCWDGQVKKINANTFQIHEKNFIPKQDLDIIFFQFK